MSSAQNVFFEPGIVVEKLIKLFHSSTVIVQIQHYNLKISYGLQF